MLFLQLSFCFLQHHKKRKEAKSAFSKRCEKAHNTDGRNFVWIFVSGSLTQITLHRIWVLIRSRNWIPDLKLFLTPRILRQQLGKCQNYFLSHLYNSLKVAQPLQLMQSRQIRHAPSQNPKITVQDMLLKLKTRVVSFLPSAHDIDIRWEFPQLVLWCSQLQFRKCKL